MFDVVRPGLVSTSPAFVRSSASHVAGPHGQLAQKTVNRAPIAGAGRSTQFAHQFVTAPPLVCSVVWSNEMSNLQYCHVFRIFFLLKCLFFNV